MNTVMATFFVIIQWIKKVLYFKLADLPSIDHANIGFLTYEINKNIVITETGPCARHHP